MFQIPLLNCLNQASYDSYKPKKLRSYCGRIPLVPMLSHGINVWYISLHLLDWYGKCRQVMITYTYTSYTLYWSYLYGHACLKNITYMDPMGMYLWDTYVQKESFAKTSFKPFSQACQQQIDCAFCHPIQSASTSENWIYLDVVDQVVSRSYKHTRSFALNSC